MALAARAAKFPVTESAAAQLTLDGGGRQKKKQKKERVKIAKGCEEGGILRIPSGVQQTKKKRSHNRQLVGIKNKLLIAGWDFCQKERKEIFSFLFNLVLIYFALSGF